MVNYPMFCRLGAAKFIYENSAKRNLVFLWEDHPTAPRLRPTLGWKIVGYGEAPHKGSTNGFFAVMFEKLATHADADHPEGERIWMHSEKAWLAGNAA